eukprot:Nitzschia sp. Nitz4//scaffold31_size150131//110698//114270//NITZ4_002845-RA/size150131-processed-gene-0.142-mRNA-1//-1//CDS//3329547710//8689//frame0
MVKSKVRFDGLDVAAMVAHWNRVALGRRIINIYNGPNGETYLIKLDKLPGETSNMMLILESGIRFHVTNEAYENPGMPSPFCAKLRKHLRGLRLEAVQQLGLMDRVIMMSFGSGDAQRHNIILELYSKGNLLLTNSSYIVLSLLRSHDYDDAVKVQVGHAYPVTYATTMEALPADGEEKVPETATTTLLAAPNPLEWYQNFVAQQQSSAPATANKKKKGGNHDMWRPMLLGNSSGVSHYGPSLVDHCLLVADIDSKQVPPSTLDAEAWLKLQNCLQEEGDRILKALELGDETMKGYIIYQDKQVDKSESTNGTMASPYADKYLLEFQPHLLKQHEGSLHLEYDNFNGAVDAYFSHIESQKRVHRAETQQAQAQQRLEKIRQDQEQRLEQLMEQQEIMRKQAELVEAHAEMVENAIQVVNSALDSGMDWDKLQALVDIEKNQNQNPVAKLIHKLLLDQDALVLRLETFDDDDDDDETGDSPKTMDVTISLKETAYANASNMFANYRANKEKGQRTIEANAAALQAAEENAQRQLQEAKNRKSHLTSNLQTKRKPLWFEKFNWFITSDNYLVIAGRDAQQNEQIVKRYMRVGDAYLHADVHGASSCILRAKRRRLPNGKTQTLPLSEQALREAGSFTICQSSAWKSRMVTSAWWVEPHQVSKTAPTGEYLTVGSFMIRGKKTYLQPSQLELGLAVLFRLGDDDSVARHKNERRDFALMQLESIEEAEGGVMQVPTQPTTTISSNKEQPSSSPPPVKEAVQETTKPLEEAREETEAVDTLEAQPVEQDDTNDLEEDTSVSVKSENTDAKLDKKAKKGLSVKERKLIKKYGSLEAAEAAEKERLEAESAKQSKKGSKPSATEQALPAPKRGKKTKLKRVAKKYADQDDDDLELAMLALHAGEKEKKNDKKKKPEISETAKEAAAQTMALLKKDTSVVAEDLRDDVKSILASCVAVKGQGSDGEATVRWDKFDADALEQLMALEPVEAQVAAAKRLHTLKETTRIDNFSASLAGILRTIRKYGHEGLLERAGESGEAEGKRMTKAEKENEKEAWKKTLAEEGVVDEELEDDAVDDTVELGKLTGKPQEGDLVLFAVPVCAPYQSLTQYTYRVKLTPGNMKRGKATKACLELFLKDNSSGSGKDRDKDLIKKVADNEWVSAIAGDVKISAAGASKTLQNQKGKKNQGKKNQGKKKK